MAPWKSFTIIDDDWSRLQRQRGRLKEALLNWEILEAMERTQPKKPETVAESKYEPTDYERAVLAKQAQRLKDQVRVPRIRFVEDQRGGRWEFDHPDQAIAFALLKEAFGTADDQSANGLLHYLCTVLPR
jgi:lipoate-protein ligase B